MDLPGRPAGNVDHLRLGAAVWEHLAWEIWNLERHLDRRVRTLLEGWSGPGAEAFEKRWTELRQGFPELDHHLHTVADRLRVIAFTIHDGQEEYDQTLAEAGLVGVAGIAATVLTVGGSDLVAGEVDAALAMSLAGKLTELGVALSRLGRLLSELADALGKVATRFTVNLAIQGPNFAHSPAGGAAIGVGLSLASGIRDPGDLAASGLLGAAENAGGGRRGGGAGAEEGESSAPQPGGSVRTYPADSVEQAWRASLSPAQAAKQAEFDAKATLLAKPANYGAIDEPLTGEVARAIDAQSHGQVIFVNQEIVDPKAARVQALTDLDIVTDRAVIQVKSGKVRGLSAQIDRSRLVTGKTVIAYAPQMDDVTFERYQRDGYTVFRKLSDLLAFLGGHRA